MKIVLLLLCVLFRADPDLSKVNDAKAWKLINAECVVSKEDDKDVVRLKPKVEVAKGSSIGLALVEGQEFSEGTIELDLKGKGKDEASFVGVAFGAIDGKTFESIYFRPFNFMRDDPVSRTHAVQYVAWPAHTWERLRKDTPNMYEQAVQPVPDPANWFHARIEVTKTMVTVWVDGAQDPCLTVDRFQDHKQGQVGLLVDSKEGWFRNLKIQPAPGGGPTLEELSQAYQRAGTKDDVAKRDICKRAIEWGYIRAGANVDVVTTLCGKDFSPHWGEQPEGAEYGIAHFLPPLPTFVTADGKVGAGGYIGWYMVVDYKDGKIVRWRLSDKHK